ncbi:MAG TPA: LytR C-terminal domain-containing protein [Pseudoduganella sp.]
MRKLPFIATAGVLAACSLLSPVPQPAATPASSAAPDALSALGRACLEDPGNAAVWQRLGEALQAQGESERAVRMLQQARNLRRHPLAADYSALRSALAQERWPADLPRTELRAIGPALLELRRTGPAEAPGARARLEISNGNGVKGMAAAWSRALRDDEWMVVRLSNALPFAERTSRVEYRAGREQQARRLAQSIGVRAVEAGVAARAGGPDLRLVLGRDLRAPR